MATLSVRVLREVPKDLELREEDRRECELGGLTPSEAVAQSVAQSVSSYGVYVDGELLGLWGYSPTSLLGEACAAWLLTTPKSLEYPFHVLAISRRVIRLLLTMYPKVAVLADKRHERAVTWLKWLGFIPLRDEGGFVVMLAERPEGFVPWVF